MPILDGVPLAPAQAGSINPNLSRDGDTVAPIYPYTESEAPRAEHRLRTYRPNVGVPAKQIKTGQRLASYFEDFYFRVHIRPDRIALGSLASEQSRSIEVWNAWLTANPLHAVNATGAEGMTLLGPAPPPTSFAANEARQYVLAVTPNGPPTVNATFTFVFGLDSGVLRATGRRIVGWAFPPNWAHPVIERLEWLTDVLESHAGFEQRIRLRTAARRGLEYRLLIGNDRDRVKLENLLLAWQARVYGLPIWTDVYVATAPIPAGSLTLTVDTSHRSFVAEGLVGLVLCTESEFAEIDEITPNSVSLKSPLERPWPAGTKILPVQPARVQNDLRITHPAAALADATVRFEFEEEWPIPAEAGAVTYRGHPVLLAPTNWTEGVDAEYGRKLIALDYLTGRRAVDDLSGITTVRRTHRWLLHGRAEISAFRRWLAARAGRLSAFWLPSGQSDLRLVAAVGASDSALTVENRGYAANVPAAVGRRDVVITTASGQRFFRRITGATELNADTESLGLDSVLGVALLPEQVRQMSFLQLVRLDADAVEIAYHTDNLAEVGLGLTSLRDDP